MSWFKKFFTGENSIDEGWVLRQTLDGRVKYLDIVSMELVQNAEQSTPLKKDHAIALAQRMTDKVALLGAVMEAVPLSASEANSVSGLRVSASEE